LEHKGGYILYTALGEQTATLSGKLRHRAQSSLDLPAVGDWVTVQEGQIQALLPRRTAFIRRKVGTRTEAQVVASNIDTAFLVMGLDHDFNLRRLERYLLMTWESGAKPVVVLNKADLCQDLPSQVAQVERLAPGLPVIPLSALEQRGLEPLTPYLQPGQTVVLLGSSGVGKSTLTNQLLGWGKQQVQAVRADDQRGRHTTTHRELLCLPTGGLIMDTPGMRELQLWSSPASSVGNTFAEVETLTQQCRFRDCQHQEEPGCAVQAALQQGELPPERYESYQKLQRELHYQARKQDQQLYLAEKERWKKRNKEQRHGPQRY
jgi:ribosome biogenesis GTPase